MNMSDYKPLAWVIKYDDYANRIYTAWSTTKERNGKTLFEVYPKLRGTKINWCIQITEPSEKPLTINDFYDMYQLAQGWCEDENKRMFRKKIQGPITKEQAKKATIFFLEEHQYIRHHKLKVPSNEIPRFPDKEDINSPTIWKGCHWQWFIENKIWKLSW